MPEPLHDPSMVAGAAWAVSSITPRTTTGRKTGHSRMGTPLELLVFEASRITVNHKSHTVNNPSGDRFDFNEG
jgi:hypothetical protein